MHMPFTTSYKVRLHDTDMAGIIFFGSQFRFAHGAWEDLMAAMGMDFDHLFTNEAFAFVVVHAEGDYLHPLKAGDNLTIGVGVERVGTTSFTIAYQIKIGETLVGTAKTVHVAVDRKTRQKINIPGTLRNSLEPYAIARP